MGYAVEVRERVPQGSSYLSTFGIPGSSFPLVQDYGWIHDQTLFLQKTPPKFLSIDARASHESDGTPVWLQPSFNSSERKLCMNESCTTGASKLLAMHISSLGLCSGTMLIPPSKYLRSRVFLVSYRQRCWSRILSSMENGRGSNASESGTNQVTRLVRTIQSFQTKLSTQIKHLKKGLSIKIFFFLVGVYCATAFTTVIGQTGDWDIIAASLAVVIVEGIGALMYRASLPSVYKMKNLITFFNYWKAGLSLGLFFDAFKY